MKGNKFVKVSTDELLNGTAIFVKFDVMTDKICIARSMKELIIFPYIEGDE